MISWANNLVMLSVVSLSRDIVSAAAEIPPRSANPTHRLGSLRAGKCTLFSMDGSEGVGGWGRSGVSLLTTVTQGGRRNIGSLSPLLGALVRSGSFNWLRRRDRRWEYSSSSCLFISAWKLCGLALVTLLYIRLVAVGLSHCVAHPSPAAVMRSHECKPSALRLFFKS